MSDKPTGFRACRPRTAHLTDEAWREIEATRARLAAYRNKIQPYPVEELEALESPASMPKEAP